MPGGWGLQGWYFAVTANVSKFLLCISCYLNPSIILKNTLRIFLMLIKSILCGFSLRQLMHGFLKLNILEIIFNSF